MCWQCGHKVRGAVTPQNVLTYIKGRIKTETKKPQQNPKYETHKPTERETWKIS